ncbi:hypothetical protein [Lignipirellula cremea]|uniref:Uncharacterized protein n=1 Tax=Lignipirellula cremea TaxID=2528010 RepID=A0A518DU67_9BACT|nr:hypothetical protein [Lignipirellula cremea]QDU95374.1 hypothetical protein Pla8534_31890 [Lignipirellula cremea]
MNQAEETGGRQIVPGFFLSASGQATIEPALHGVLFDLALALEEATDLPVDVQHTAAAIIMASNQGEIDFASPLRSDDPDVNLALARHVRRLFARYGPGLGSDD